MTAQYTSTQLQGISDLVVIAPIKTGVIEGALDSITYLQRLDRVLRLLNRGRSAGREAATQASPFSDLVGRLNIVHFFRFAIVPPLRDGEPHRLLLNVTFDGGWEAYMRVIWRDLGPLLDLICCHCERYPLAHTSSFAEYIAWVREHEAQAGFFYADSEATIGDQRYDAAIEAMCRANGPGNLDSRAARYKLKTPDETLADATTAARRDRFAAVAAGLRSTVAFHSLTRSFPGFAGRGDAGILLRVVKALHPEFITLIREGVFKEPEFAPIRAAAAEPLEWLSSDTAPRTIPADRLPTDPDELLKQTQIGVLKSYPQITHGCLALLRIEGKPVSEVIKFVEQWPVSSGTDEPLDGIYRTIAFTHAGLATLGVPTRRLSQFPQEFIDGMEVRAGILGDIRGNHPQQWQRPLRNWPPGDASPVPIELATVHVVVQLRKRSDAASADDLLPEFSTELRRLAAAGLTVLAWQPMRRHPQGDVLRDHFGFADGLSQPTLDNARPKPKYWSDTVATGDLLVGYRNSRDDGPYPTKPDPLMDKGSFLVVRKLKQDVARLNEVLAAEVEKLEPNLEERQRLSNVNEIKERMMGRRLNGEPLVSRPVVGNDFNYAADNIGGQCPFQSHVRRTNPRDGRMPRIMRCGMSYGPRFEAGTEQKERGLMFMAYNASIAEQFEVIQRWVAGGNSSGISSEQSDPFLGVPERGESRLFRCPVGNKVVRIDLGDKPIVQLQWGLYLFAPSVEALRQFNEAVTLPPPSEPPKCNTPIAADGPIAATEADVLSVLRDPGQIFSVRGYGDRLSQSVGNGHLGQDPHDPDRAHADEINKLIASVSEVDAFNVAHSHASRILKRFLNTQRMLPGMDRLVLDSLIDEVLGEACREWFGLPDANDKYMKLAGKTANPDEPARCPGHFYAVARYVFSPTPSPTDEMLGKAHGKILTAAAQRFVDDGMPNAGPLSLSRRISAIIGPGDRDRIARTIVGVMLGFPPTTGGNLLSVLGTWLTTKELWNLQRALLPLADTGVYERASDVLRSVMIRTMCQRPVPPTIWRTAVAPCAVGGTEINAQTKVPVALGKALERGATPELIFGRAPDSTPPTVHGCPGRAMALGLMLGTICALLGAGELLPGGDPVSVILRPMPG